MTAMVGSWRKARFGNRVGSEPDQEQHQRGGCSFSASVTRYNFSREKMPRFAKIRRKWLTHSGMDDRLCHVCTRDRRESLAAADGGALQVMPAQAHRPPPPPRHRLRVLRRPDQQSSAGIDLHSLHRRPFFQAFFAANNAPEAHVEKNQKKRFAAGIRLLTVA